MTVQKEIANELNDFMVKCLKRHARALQFEDKPELRVIVAILEAVSMQIVFNGLSDEQAIQALQGRLDDIRKEKAKGEVPPRTLISLTPKAKA